MINETKSALKLLRYSFGIKMTLIFGLIFLALGAFFMTFGNSFMLTSGSLLFLVTAMWPTQLVYSLTASDMVQTSPYKKAFQTSVPTIFNAGGMLIIFLIMSLVIVIRFRSGFFTETEVINFMMQTSLLSICLMIYVAFAYKYFAASLVLFFIVYMGIYFSSILGVGFSVDGFMPGFSIPAAFITSTVIMIAGGILEYLLSLAVYKVPVSKYAQMASLRKYM